MAEGAPRQQHVAQREQHGERDDDHYKEGAYGCAIKQPPPAAILSSRAVWIQQEAGCTHCWNQDLVPQMSQTVAQRDHSSPGIGVCSWYDRGRLHDLPEALHGMSSVRATQRMACEIIVVFGMYLQAGVSIWGMGRHTLKVAHERMAKMMPKRVLKANTCIVSLRVNKRPQEKVGLA